MLKLLTSHNKTAGFFSNCSIRLAKITEYFIENNKLPSSIDSSLQFRNYKEDENNITEDLSKYFFEENSVEKQVSKCLFRVNEQFRKYKDIDIQNISPYVQTFFSPSSHIKDIILTLEKKYSIDYDNTCSVYYRGNDKVVETGLADYEEFFNKAEEIQQKNSNVKFLVQTDELEFAEAFKQKFPNSFWFDEVSMINHDPISSVHHSLPRDKRKEHASYFFAAVLIVSKANHIITYSGNCGLWAVLYRGNAQHVYQYLKIKNQKTGEIKKHCGWLS